MRLFLPALLVLSGCTVTVAPPPAGSPAPAVSPKPATTPSAATPSASPTPKPTPSPRVERFVAAGFDTAKTFGGLEPGKGCCNATWHIYATATDGRELEIETSAFVETGQVLPVGDFAPGLSGQEGKAAVRWRKAAGAERETASAGTVTIVEHVRDDAAFQDWITYKLTGVAVAGLVIDAEGVAETQNGEP